VQHTVKEDILKNVSIGFVYKKVNVVLINSGPSWVWLHDEKHAFF